MNRGLSLIFALASLIVLAGCTISGGNGGGGGGDPFPNDDVDTVTVQPDFESSPVRSGQILSAGQSHVYRIDIDSTVAQNNDVVYFDAIPEEPGQVNGYLEVTAYNVSGGTATPLFRSTNNQWFGRPGDPGLASLSPGEFEPASIADATPVCGGPCVVVPTPSDEGTAYVRVEAIQGFVEYDFYVVATDFSDLGEPNNTFANAESVGTGEVVQGAIETIGDRDWYVSSADVDSVAFEGDGDLNLRAVVYDEGGSFETTLFPGDSYTLPLEEPFQQLRVEVYSNPSQQRAASAGRAIYTVEFYND